ncbi:unnamed protein product [Paramecium octaurelia]|uniref:Transmembrane protein n=1 Tax=Paramecium octaurelia TaxID=43137 RepID=A0A8S1V2Q9_PAROT|nr:unnamed protein product [Paramecium octaurelia]
MQYNLFTTDSKYQPSGCYTQHFETLRLSYYIVQYFRIGPNILKSNEIKPSFKNSTQSQSQVQIRQKFQKKKQLQYQSKQNNNKVNIYFLPLNLKYMLIQIRLHKDMKSKQESVLFLYFILTEVQPFSLLSMYKTKRLIKPLVKYLDQVPQENSFVQVNQMIISLNFPFALILIVYILILTLLVFLISILYVFKIAHKNVSKLNILVNTKL